VTLGIKLDPQIFGIVGKIAVEEDRSLSHVIERLLRSHPIIEERNGRKDSSPTDTV
jgi:hypothetical protein